MSQRVQIQTLSTHTSHSQRAIANIVGCSQSAVSRVMKANRERGSLETRRKGHLGKKKIITKRLSNRILSLSKRDPTLSSTEIKEEIGKPAISVSCRRIREHLQQNGRRAIRPKTKPLLNERLRKARLQWAKDHQHWSANDWSKVSCSV
jgi:transposase